eukprot:TRINITY_DN26000_c0_g1_i1.p1 TRINITY_DN26000_c0_g1~~TRINITY_DN26000_c0_g1_i1.p1  ORF type:complete len:102 (-),score=17.88 TRINITY_DN26000_c0_g1_i1:9-314(-)
MCIRDRVIAEKHDDFIEEYIITGKSMIINNEVELYGLTKTGNILCISAIVKLAPSLTHGLRYIGVMRKRNANDNFILTLSLIHICRCRRYAVCRSRWSPYH